MQVKQILVRRLPVVYNAVNVFMQDNILINILPNIQRVAVA